MGAPIFLVTALAASGLVGCTRAAGITLNARAADHTDRASVLVEGTTNLDATVVIEGGLLPVPALVRTDGTFRAEVPLRAGTANLLVARSQKSDGEASVKLPVVQQPAAATGTLAGRVVDAVSAQPVAGATVGWGPVTATTAADGTYRMTGVPDGYVAVQTRAAGRLTSLTVGSVSGGRGLIRDTGSQTLAAPVTVGPEGGSWSGQGWKVDVPAGAVPAPTPLYVTPLAFTGDKDLAYGVPVVDLSPRGLRFAQPVVVTLDPTVFGLDPAATRVRTLDPDGPSSRLPVTTVAGTTLRFGLSDLAGEEIREEPTPGIFNKFGGPDKWCQPFTDQADAAAAQTYLQTVLLPILRAGIGTTSHDFWAEYLTPGLATGFRRDIVDQATLDAFRDSPESQSPIAKVLLDLTTSILSGTPLKAPDDPAHGQISDFPSPDGTGPLGQHVPLEWGGYVFSPPVNLAGGIGGAELPSGQQFPDDRTLSGTWKLAPTADDRGVITKVELQGDVTLDVLDAIDFCPGGRGNSFQQNFTIPMSRLEMTPHPGGGFWAKDVLFEAKVGVPLANYTKTDLTKVYANDPDGDGWPDRQPWAGASFRLDNCPAEANAGQEDRDGNGKGDACDTDRDPNKPGPGGPGGPTTPTTPPSPPTDPEPDQTPKDPGPARSWGDPHLTTFDHGSYDMQAAGDYVLAQSTADDFEVQTRYYRPEGSNVSVSLGLAVRFGGSTVAFADHGDYSRLPVLLDGQPVTVPTTGELALPGGGALLMVDGYAGVRLPDGTEVSLRGGVTVKLAPARWGKMRGLVGNADRDPRNDLTARDGFVVTDATDRAQLYDHFAASWRVEGSASLFRSVFSPPQPYPTTVATVAGLPAEARANAERICRAKGLLPGTGLDACILDVGTTGDARWADDAAAAAGGLLGAVDIGALQGRVEDRTEARTGQRIQGNLGAPFVTDEHTVELAAGTTVRVTIPSCPGTGTFGVTLVAPSGRPVGRSAGAGCGSLAVAQLRESGRYTLAVHDTGGFTGAYDLQIDSSGVALECAAGEVAPNDDGASAPVPLPFEVDFFGQKESTVYVNNNGNVTFGGGLGRYTPGPIDADERTALIAPFFADVDTRGEGSNPVRYGTGSVGGRQAFCVDWDGVGYYNRNADKLNSFRLFLVDRGDVAPGAFDIVFVYRKLTWETGDASGGTNGLGGNSAAVGWTNGTGQPGTFLERPGSRQPGSFLDGSATGLARSSTGSDQPGVHVYPIRPR